MSTEDPHDLIPPPTHDRVDPFVQRWVAGTNGNLYAPLINKLERYPIPLWPVERSARPGELLLDIGCGWGRWLVSAGQRGYVPLGIDLKLEPLQAARRVTRAHGLRGYVVGADLRRLPFRPGSLDMVHSYSVIQHVHREWARQCVAEIERVLRPGGRMLLEFPIQPGLTNWRHRISEAEQADSASWCVRYYKEAELHELFRAFEGLSIWPDCYLGIGVKREDLDILPWKYKPIIVVSELLRGLAKVLPPVAKLADSVYVTGQKRAASESERRGAQGDPDSNLWILPFLQCPQTGEGLRLEPGNRFLVSERSGIRYPVVDEIPMLLASEAF